ncbi:hypothetical protein SERLA73DRAFT_190598 [Serpula lacrymans var. lacrymans S7.3]|uniref:Uncharacterized protein n=2 Tax=Serpula lacrymans var. lacrymans TaxID=341189 RepID=F8QG08_SERL3|nr:uncharacterized protein SERLADRAFT_463461 [Serpula lacrymans var. lacrymans S7.9]EGN92756.1 hypothetical protein SERLA73DRAFT_190598 [Serpula lacrymans var. lacrymans S7.3]EGO26415.1 hypothetical protein SERLADRAFT_463461 [Serpula lacrymans var. lacrymans S7.9]
MWLQECYERKLIKGRKDATKREIDRMALTLAPLCYPDYLQILIGKTVWTAFSLKEVSSRSSQKLRHPVYANV